MSAYGELSFLKTDLLTQPLQDASGGKKEMQRQQHIVFHRDTVIGAIRRDKKTPCYLPA